MSRDLPTPGSSHDVADLFLIYLDFYRDTVADKVHGLSEDELRVRFAGTDEVPSFTAILFHVLQEYARHAGHLDVARELVDGTVGE